MLSMHRTTLSRCVHSSHATGFGDSLDCTGDVEPLEEYIDGAYRQYLADESKADRSGGSHFDGVARTLMVLLSCVLEWTR